MCLCSSGPFCAEIFRTVIWTLDLHFYSFSLKWSSMEHTSDTQLWRRELKYLLPLTSHVVLTAKGSKLCPHLRMLSSELGDINYPLQSCREKKKKKK